MADDTVADVVIVEPADVEVVDTESFTGSDWYAVEDTELELEEQQ